MPPRLPADFFERLPELVNADHWLVHRGRFFDGALRVEIGEVPFHVEIAAGRVAELKRGPTLMRSTFLRVRAAAETWAKHWEPMPVPHFHDLMAMSKAGHLTLDGEVQPMMANLQYLKDVLAAPRQLNARTR
jgi:hypothetical protein